MSRMKVMCDRVCSVNHRFIWDERLWLLSNGAYIQSEVRKIVKSSKEIVYGIIANRREIAMMGGHGKWMLNQ